MLIFLSTEMKKKQKYLYYVLSKYYIADWLNGHLIHQNWMWSTGLLFQNGIVNILVELYIFVGVSWCCECHNEIIYMNGGNHNYLPEGWFTLYLRNTYFKSSLSSRSCCIKGKFEYCLVWFSFPKVQVDLKIQIKNCNKQKAN